MKREAKVAQELGRLCAHLGSHNQAPGCEGAFQERPELPSPKSNAAFESMTWSSTTSPRKALPRAPGQFRIAVVNAGGTSYRTCPSANGPGTERGRRFRRPRPRSG